MNVSGFLPGGSDEASSCCAADTCRSGTDNTGLPARTRRKKKY